MVWNIMNWLNKAHREQPREHVLETCSNGESLFPVQLNQLNSEADPFSVQSSVVADDTSDTAEPGGKTDAGGKSLFDSIRMNRWQHEAGATKSAMAYWRKNTRREQPADKVVYDQFHDTGTCWIDRMPAEAASMQRATVDQALTELSPMLVKNTKDGMYGLYARRVQTELERRFEDRMHALSIVNEEEERETHFQEISKTHSYRSMHPTCPEYIDDYFFSQPQADNGEAPSEQSATPNADPARVGSVSDGASATIPEPILTPPGELVEAKLRSWDKPAQLELRETLQSISSSPECERLIEAKASRAEAKPEAEQEAAQQRVTLERLPYAQFIDVRIAVADHPDTSREMLEQLADDQHPDVRFAIAENHNASREILIRLANDENPYVAHRARLTLKRLDGGKRLELNLVRRDKIQERKTS